MAHRIGEPVVVRAEQNGAPGSFLWRDRIYVVREVLGHWQERRSWWASAAARAVHGDTARRHPDHQPGHDQHTGQHTGQHAGQPAGQHGLSHEREIWRVEATAGRTFGIGVYDLALEGPSPVLAERPAHRRTDDARSSAGVSAGVSAAGADGSETGAVTPVAPPDQRWRLLRVAD